MNIFIKGNETLPNFQWKETYFPFLDRTICCKMFLLGLKPEIPPFPFLCLTFLKTLSALLALMIQGYFWNLVILKICVNPFKTIDAIAAHGELLALMELGL